MCSIFRAVYYNASTLGNLSWKRRIKKNLRSDLKRFQFFDTVSVDIETMSKLFCKYFNYAIANRSLSSWENKVLYVRSLFNSLIKEHEAAEEVIPLLRKLERKIEMKPLKNDAPLQQAARNFCSSYENLNQHEKVDFLKYMVRKHKEPEEFMKNTNEKPGYVKIEKHINKTTFNGKKNSLNPVYEEIFSLVLKLDTGTKFIVNMRGDFLDLLPLYHSEDNLGSGILSICNGLREKLSSSFQPDSLNLERITWDSPCDMLQKLCKYEAVHPVKNWLDLKRRVGPFRRCYVYTHKCMDREPLVVLYTALMTEISSNISSIICSNSLDFDKKQTATTVFPDPMENEEKIQAAVFYSIYSTQKGLRGIDLGKMLIKQVIHNVIQEFPHIRQFSTLSPIPGFRDWLLIEIKKGHSVINSFIKEKEISDLNKKLHNYGFTDIWSAVSHLIKTNDWIHNSNLTNIIHIPLLRACAHYLLKEKRRSYALNSVAHFHLRNGAVLWRLNWNADTSSYGLNNSCGIMANYRYYLDDMELNSKNYDENYFILASEEVIKLLSMPPRSVL